jgi:DNA polymerase-3 subunit alpha
VNSLNLFQDFQDYKGCEPIGAALPRVEIDKKYYKDLGLPESSTNAEFLRKLARENILKKGIDKKKDKKRYYDQAKYEIEVFEETGLTDYIIALWDIVNFANENGIKTSPGRGSAASSLILFLINVTKIDPIKYDLIFERFVSKTRIKKVGEENGITFFDGSLLADVDLDFDYARRHEVISYIENKYKGRTAKILTFNTFSSKLCIKEAVKFFNNASEEESGRVSDLIQKKHGFVSSLTESLEDNEKFQEWAHDNEEVIKYARKVEDLKKNAGQHPSGIAISFQEIDSICPLQKSKDGGLITGYEMNDVADLMVKFDILGLRTISIANLACEKIGINIDDIDPEDPFIYEMLQNFKSPVGLFQISASVNTSVCQKIKPINIDELSDVIALARPGSLAFVDDYIKQKDDPKRLGLNEDFDDILAQSKNVLLYQESAMALCKRVFGLPPEDAESLRKIIGKKLRDKMPEWRGKIFEAAEKKGVDKSIAEYFWKAMEASANYSFNKCIFEEETVELSNGKIVPLKLCKKGYSIKAFNTKSGQIEYVDVKNIYHNHKQIYQVELENGKTIRTSKDHKFLCENGDMVPLKDILRLGLRVLSL